MIGDGNGWNGVDRASLQEGKACDEVARLVLPAYSCSPHCILYRQINGIFICKALAWVDIQPYLAW